MKQTVTERLLKGSQAIWDGYHIHPFVRGIADGTLDKQKFEYYMIQDYLYLIDYAKVFALGVAKAKDVTTMQLFAGYVSQILDGEMSIHKSYMKRLGISLQEAEQTPTAIDTHSYNSYMLRVAFEEGAAEIAATILSCAVSYEVIAKQMVATNPACLDHEFYGEWVSGYASEEYAAGNEKLVELLERLTVDYSEQQVQHLEEIFRVCSRFEAAFWDMAWEMRE